MSGSPSKVAPSNVVGSSLTQCGPGPEPSTELPEVKGFTQRPPGLPFRRDSVEARAEREAEYIAALRRFDEELAPRLRRTVERYRTFAGTHDLQSPSLFGPHGGFGVLMARARSRKG